MKHSSALLSTALMGLALLGISLMGLVVLVMVVSGVLAWAREPATAGRAVGALLELSAFLAVAAFAEELLLRGYPLQVIAEALGGPAAVVLTAVVFAGLHALNPHVSPLALVNIALAGILLGAALWFMQRNVEPTDRQQALDASVFDIDLLHVDSLVVQHNDQEIEIERRGSEWWIVRPIEARADEAKVGHLVSSSEALARVETITREQREHRTLSLGDYGLDIPRTSLTYRTPLGVRRLLIGHDARPGERTYVRMDGQSDVMLAEGELRAALPESLEAMRDRVLLHGQAARVTRLEIERPDGGATLGDVVRSEVRISDDDTG